MPMCVRILLFLLICGSSSLSWANPIKEMFEQGVAAMATNDYESATKHFQKVLEMHPNFSPAYNYLGMAHKEKGTQLKDVLWYFERATEIDPNYTEAWTNLGKTYYTMGKFPEAEEACRKALDLSPDDVTANLAMAWTYLLGMSRPDDAIKNFKKTIDKTDMPYANFGLGLAYFMNDQRIEMLDMITALRKKGEEGFARELERIVRDNRYDPVTERGKPLLVPGVTTYAQPLIPERPVTEIAESSEANRAVRIRKANPSTPKTPRRDSENSPTGSERIRQLQDRGQPVYR